MPRLLVALPAGDEVAVTLHPKTQKVMAFAVKSGFVNYVAYVRNGAGLETEAFCWIPPDMPMEYCDADQAAQTMRDLEEKLSEPQKELYQSEVTRLTQLAAAMYENEHKYEYDRKRPSDLLLG